MSVKTVQTHAYLNKPILVKIENENNLVCTNSRLNAHNSIEEQTQK